MQIRAEKPDDIAAIADLIRVAFAGAAHSEGTEAAIVAALRARGALTISLVAEDRGLIVGHVAFSPVRIDGTDRGWFGLGPVAVHPDRQRRGIGRMLIAAGLDLLRSQGAGGCVVLGDPAYCRRFGFASDPALRYPAVPAAYFQRVGFGSAPSLEGIVAYDEAFAAT